jgi:hypothetical protein
MESLLIIPMLWITVGGLLQALRYIRNQDDFKLYILSVIISFVGFLPGKNEYSYNLNEHIGQYLFVFIFTNFFLLRNRVLPKIDELSVLVTTILFWILAIIVYPHSIPLLLLVVSCIPTVFVLYALFTSEVLPHAIQVILYVWYQIVGIYLIVSPIRSLESLPESYQRIATITVPELITIGMMIFIIGIQFVSVIYIIPIPGKHQSISDRLEEVRAYIAELIEKFSDTQLDPKIAFCIATVVGIVAYGNTKFHVMNDTLLINGIFLVTPIFSHFLRPPKDKPPRILSMKYVNDTPQESQSS